MQNLSPLTLVDRCILRCWAEAVALGFPPKMGLAVHDGITQAELEQWNDIRFLEWHAEVSDRFQVQSWCELYVAVEAIRAEYGGYIRIYGEEPWL
jgi:hypothetical protein